MFQVLSEQGLGVVGCHVCVSTFVTKSLCFSQFSSRSGRDGRFPSHANEAREIDWMEVRTQTSVPARMKAFAHAVTLLILLLFPCIPQNRFP